MNKSFPLLNDKIKLFDFFEKNDLFLNYIVFKFSNEINLNEIIKHSKVYKLKKKMILITKLLVILKIKDYL